MTDPSTTDALRVERPGVRTLLEDLGRPGYARLGVTASGAWDRGALTLANRLVGNPEDAAGLEVLLGGLTLRALADVTVAVTGADVPVTVDGYAAATFGVVPVPAGAVLDLGRPRLGLRAYVAVRGGLTGRRVFGSLSADPTTGLGPAPLASGDVLAIGPDPGTPTEAPDTAPTRAPTGGEIVLRAVPGPRDDWFAPDALALLAGTAWEVSPHTDRVGTRLLGPSLPRARTGELSSEGLVRGAVQVPASGLPLVFGPDHPTTGGYPVIACVTSTDADALAQAAPGTVVRFELLRRPW